MVKNLCGVVVAFVAGCGASAGSTTPPTASSAVKAEPKIPTTVLRFMKPAPGVAKQRGKPRTWLYVRDRRHVVRLTKLADNEPAQFARALYAQAWRVAGKRGTPVLHIAVERGGNYARRGFVVVNAQGQKTAHPKVPYLILGERRSTFRSTLLHETGHAIHALLAGDASRGSDAAAVAPIPHSTAAVTDRRTAFNEGFAIHLETVNAHCGRDPRTRAFYDRARLRHGVVKPRRMSAEYYAAIKDLMSYAQTFARYQHVRDGLYAFAAATTTADYLRLQLSPARDRRELRSAGQLVASEGFVASVVFQIVAARGCKSLSELVPRYEPLFRALRAAESTKGVHDAIPVLDFVDALRRATPSLGKHAIEVFLDLSHGVTVDASAASQWRQLHDAALNLDLVVLKKTIATTEVARASWLVQALASTDVLAKYIGPVVPVQAPGVQVGLVIFGRKLPLSFDINAVDARVLRLVPGLSKVAVATIVSERSRALFRDVQDLAMRTKSLGVVPKVLAPMSR